MNRYQREEALTRLVLQMFHRQPRGINERYIRQYIASISNFRVSKEEEMYKLVMDRLVELEDSEWICQVTKKTPSPYSKTTIYWQLTGKGFHGIKDYNFNNNDDDDDDDIVQ